MGIIEPRKITISENKYYLEFDKIRLVFENDELVGWYKPEVEDE